jgi:putative membrane protein
MKQSQFDTEFQSWLYEAVQHIEKKSSVELMVIISPHSNTYPEVPLRTGFVTMFSVFTALVFSPLEYGAYFFYSLTVAAFIIGYILPYFSEFIKRLSLGKRTLARNTEIRARATFQKVGMHNTKNETGVLIYISSFERVVHILPDRGARLAIPEDVWKKMEVEVAKVFKAENAKQHLLMTLDALVPLFAKHMPAQPDDINELPETIEIDLFE